MDFCERISLIYLKHRFINAPVHACTPQTKSERRLPVAKISENGMALTNERFAWGTVAMALLPALDPRFSQPPPALNFCLRVAAHEPRSAPGKVDSLGLQITMTPRTSTIIVQVESFALSYLLTATKAGSGWIGSTWYSKWNMGGK